MARKCVFCSGSPTTKEHAVPGWIRTLVSPPGDVPHEWGEYKTGAKRRWQSKHADFAVSAVCQRCNSGWMSRLESDVKPYLTPMIVGQRTTLLDAEKELVARWVFKTALMLDWGNAFSIAACLARTSALSERLKSPTDVFIWLGASAVGGWVLRGKSRANDPHAQGTKQAYGMTMRIGHRSADTESAVELFLHREDAEVMIGDVRDEPELAERLRIEEIELQSSG